jgi:hypothetical protein
MCDLLSVFNLLTEIVAQVGAPLILAHTSFRDLLILEVINVSYEAWIKKHWLTILRYDSTHRYLHQHTRFSLTKEKEFISKEHLLQTGSHQDWLTFAIADIKTNFSSYRRAFFHRSYLDETEKA